MAGILPAKEWLVKVVYPLKQGLKLVVRWNRVQNYLL